MEDSNMTATAAFNDHTPGPWKVLLNYDNRIDETILGRHTIKGADDYNVARVWELDEILDKPGLTEANARLIAAAPDLLAALESLEKMTSDLPLPSVHNVIRAAIEKARKEG